VAKVFRLHFNRIAMQRGDPKVWTIRTSAKCLHAEHIKVDVPLQTVFDPQGRQPRAFLKGFGNGYWVTMTNGFRYLWITQMALPNRRWARSQGMRSVRP
jgi:hypothetical protein